MLPRWIWDFVKVVGGDVVADVRGWRFDVVGPRFLARPSISDVTSPCPEKRDVWIRRVMRMKIDSDLFVLGRAVHEVFLYPFRRRYDSLWDVLRGFEKLLASFDPLAKRYKEQFVKLFRKSFAFALYSVEEGIPISVEPMIPAASIGLSDFVKPDLLVGFLPVDISLASNEKNFERKELALTGYALAIESWIGHPIDFGVAIYVNLFTEPMLTWRIIRVDDSLRRTFLEMRDKVAMILEHPDEPPPVSSNCPQSCPYIEVCKK
ncbi:type I-A CRISPR-associated protein Cas4/Csa1 [Ignisphaera sp. 4213-co]|uniref:Type I-A CRISPR-associated protein Cas4/Csa1 n=1 Tax=Ignisphaera cupida TaxID=3050454 RepID=A0ABD4Z7S4_9CREN|nr:type I-A CRISPR-associated protein Cas4/Csa1 [Ignisphaera sp. 4213-co]MDK6029401.1 type I-A CRISPR-associated protein Cas4/Csa1 [Ignisphaera sp. 4213-co]